MTALYSGVPGYTTSTNATVGSDPSYLAFLRSSGLADQYDAADAAAQQQMLMRSTASTLEDLDYNDPRELSRRYASFANLGEGGGRSSVAANAIADMQYGQARRRGQVETDAYSQIARLNSQTSRRMADRQQRGAELAMQVAYNRSLGDGTP